MKVGTWGAWLVKMTSEVETQPPLAMLQRSVADVPTGTPVTVVVRDDAVVIVAVPDTNDHEPVPALGALAAMVKDPVLQLD